MLHASRLFAGAVIAVLAMCSAFAQPTNFSIDTASITELQEEMAAKRLSSRELVEHFLRRIEAIDRHGPKLNSVIEVNPDARDIADAMDVERRSGKLRGPLHGIPILLKDNIDTADSMLTTAGSLALIGSKPQKDAFIVSRLRDAGAVILGKTNLSEWANFRSWRSSSGWSARGGLTVNPYDTARTACGSSSGAGVAIAASLAVASIGTETDGSIVCPSSIAGIVGLKPTIGLVSRSGIIPISAVQDTAGPMTRSVADAAIVLAAITSEDPTDAATTALRGRQVPDYLEAARAGRLQGMRIGVARKFAGFHPEVDAVFEQALDVLTKGGAEIVDPVELEKPSTMDNDEMLALFYEFKDGINRYLATRSPGPRTLEEIIAFNIREKQLEMPHFGQELFDEAQAKGPLTSREYVKVRERLRRQAGAEGIDAVMKKHRLDAIAAPTVGPAWTIDLINGDHYSGGSISSPPAIAGYPHITVPAGQVHGLPVGISFVAGAWGEPALLTIAGAFEELAQTRVAPPLMGCGDCR